MTTLAVGAQAPQFVLNGIDSKPYELGEGLRRGPLLLIFIKSGCPACDLALPYFLRLRHTYPEGWTLWAVSQDSRDRSQEYAQRLALTFPVLVDVPSYLVSRAYDPPATPTMFFIEPDGSIAFTNHGFSKGDVNQLSSLIANHLKVEAKVIAERDDGQPSFRPG